MAVLIFSIGLIGLASLMVMATRSNHAAYLRTQVTFLANSMANRMSANPAGVWSGSYNNAAYPVTGTAVPCLQASPCSPADLATHDQQAWSAQLTTFLPDPKATIACTGVGAVGYDPTAQLNFRPPYGGTCKMTISWTERTGANQSTTSTTPTAPQKFTWDFQP